MSSGVLRLKRCGDDAVASYDRQQPACPIGRVPKPNRSGARTCGLRIGWALGFLLLIQVGVAAAHSLQLFAAADGDLITGRAHYAGGHPASGISIQILGADRKPLATLRSDASGAFSYRAEAARDLLVVAESPDGHRTQWPIHASELVGVSDPGASERAHHGDGGADRHPHPHHHDDEGSAAPVVSDRAAEPARLDREVIVAIEQAVARQVRPLRESLAEAQARASVHEVLGGLGYIVGIAGLGLWWSARRKRERRDAGNGP